MHYDGNGYPRIGWVFVPLGGGSGSDFISTGFISGTNFISNRFAGSGFVLLNLGYSGQN
jgi:hypothetical protein